MQENAPVSDIVTIQVYECCDRLYTGMHVQPINLCQCGHSPACSAPTAHVPEKFTSYSFHTSKVCTVYFNSLDTVLIT